jgi:hypothetical protein
MVVSYGQRGGGSGGRQLGEVLRSMGVSVTEGMPQLRVNAIRAAMREAMLEEGQVELWEKESGNVVRKAWWEFLGLLGIETVD